MVPTQPRDTVNLMKPTTVQAAGAGAGAAVLASDDWNAGATATSAGSL